MSEELPEGWAETTMGAVAEVIGGGTPPAKDASNFCDEGGHPWITPADLSGFNGVYISRGARNLTSKGLRESSAKLMPKGTVLMSSRAPIGYLAVAANEIATNQGFKSFVCPSILEPRFVLNWLRSINDDLQELGSGSTFAEISGSKAKEIPLRVAPLAEQHRIVAKVESLLEQVSRAKARLDRVQGILKRFRQAVLAAGCSGELTKEWRETNLVMPSIAERTPCDCDGWIDAELPLSWGLRAVGDIAKIVTGSTPSTKQSAYHGGDVPFAKPGDLGSWEPLHSTQDWVTSAGAAAGRLLPANTVLVSCIGNLGKVAFLGKSAICNQQINAILPTAIASPRFVFIWASTLRGWLEAHSSETTIRIVNKGRFEQAPIPIPPIDEQAEIVLRVTELFRFADAIERRITHAANCAEKLPQAILAKAFSGELVLTEAELAQAEGRMYETAETLLARVVRHSGVRSSTGEKGRKPTVKRS